MLNISQVILMKTDSNLCRKELMVHWIAPNSLFRSYLQPCTNSMWGDESEAVAPIIWLYQIVDGQREEVFFPDLLITLLCYDFPLYWPFVLGIHRSLVNSLHKGQWHGALMFSLICARMNDWVNNCEACDLRRHRAHYDVTVMMARSSAAMLLTV